MTAPAAVARAYADKSMTVQEVAQSLDMSPNAIRRRVKLVGASTRQPRAAIALSRDALKPIWDAGVSAQEIARHLSVSVKAVQSMAYRAGWRRGRDFRPKQTLSQYINKAPGICCACGQRIEP